MDGKLTGITKKEHLNISIPTYITKYLKRFLHNAPKNPYYAPHKWTVSEYGQSTKYEKVPDKTQPIDDKVINGIEYKVVSLLY